ncbi:uncharacterized protein V1518DRAFT_427396 [Limtongia smithiae]|uniref:uncharacterized protein n=1 Tax=Limtongia smithiae TaxID=1125753 RepID=UPI0034CF387A
MTVADEHILVINNPRYSSASYEAFKNLPGVASVTVVETTGAPGRGVPLTPIPAEIWAQATVLLTHQILPPSREAVPNLKYVQLFSAGSNLLVSQPFFKENSDIIFCNASGVHGPIISEYVILMILTFFHDSQQYAKWQSEERWGKVTDFPKDIKYQYGRTIGILGYGAIGRQTARIAKALGMRLIVHSFSTPAKKERVEIAIPGSGDPDGSLPDIWLTGPERLNEFFGSGLDVLVIAAPLTPVTTKLINKTTLAMLKGAYIVNVGRGPIIDTDDLIEACESELIAGAALDVTDPEPLPAGHKLFTTKNISVTPHISGHVDAYAKNVTNIAAHNITQLRAGKAVTNRVTTGSDY